MASLEERRLAAEIVGLRKELRASTTTQQLAYSSIENGGRILVRDVDGREMMTIGRNPDGSYGSTPRNGPTPPQATAPHLIPTPGGITVSWDGEYLDSLMTPDDFSRVEVHLSDDPNMTAESAVNLVGSIESPRGTEVPVVKLTPGTTYYVAFVVRNTAGGRGPVSPVTTGQPLPYADGPGTTQALTKAEQARLLAEQAAAEVAAATSAANAAEQQAIDAMAQATVALDSADGKSKIVYSQDYPPYKMPEKPQPDGSFGFSSSPSDTYPTGTTWYMMQNGGTVITAYQKKQLSDGTQGWVYYQLADGVFKSITAAKITTGTMNAATTITTGDTSGLHTEIGQGGMRVFRPNSEGDPVPTVNVGGATADSIQIMDPATGATVAGLLEDGTAIADKVMTNSLEVGGQAVGNMYDRWDAMFGLARGFDSGFMLSAGNGPTTSTKQDVAELRYFSQANRWYKILVTMNVMKSAVGLFRLQLRYSTDGSDPADYTGNTNQIFMGMFYQGYAGMHLSCQGGGLLYAPDKDVRVVAFIENISGGGTINYYGDPRGRMWVEDAGPVINGSQAWTSGAMRTTSTSTPTQTAYDSAKILTKTFQPTWSRTWRDGGVRSDTADMVQGTYGGRDNKAAVGFGSDVASTLNGATVLNMSIRLTASSWYYSSGGTARIGNHGSGGAPSSFPGSSATFDRTWKAKSGTQSISLPSEWWPYWQSGAHRGITLGYNIPTSSSYYGRFYGANDVAEKKPALTVTYRKSG